MTITPQTIFSTVLIIADSLQELPSNGDIPDLPASSLSSSRDEDVPELRLRIDLWLKQAGQSLKRSTGESIQLMIFSIAIFEREVESKERYWPASSGTLA